MYLSQFSALFTVSDTGASIQMQQNQFGNETAFNYTYIGSSLDLIDYPYEPDYLNGNLSDSKLVMPVEINSGEMTLSVKVSLNQ